MKKMRSSRRRGRCSRNRNEDREGWRVSGIEHVQKNAWAFCIALGAWSAIFAKNILRVLCISWLQVYEKLELALCITGSSFVVVRLCMSSRALPISQLLERATVAHVCIRSGSSLP